VLLLRTHGLHRPSDYIFSNRPVAVKPLSMYRVFTIMLNILCMRTCSNDINRDAIFLTMDLTAKGVSTRIAADILYKFPCAPIFGVIIIHTHCYWTSIWCDVSQSQPSLKFWECCTERMRFKFTNNYYSITYYYYVIAYSQWPRYYNNYNSQ